MMRDYLKQKGADKIDMRAEYEKIKNVSCAELFEHLTKFNDLLIVMCLFFIGGYL